MLTSITPLGERGRANRYARTATAYLLGSVLGGTAMGTVIGVIGAVVLRPLPWQLRLGLLAAVAAAAAGLDLAGRRPVSWHRQVNENWMHAYRGTVYGAGYGLQLGVGVVTIVTTASLYAAVAAWLLVASVAGGALLGALFGVARGLPILVTRDADTAARLQAVHRRLVEFSRPADLLTAGSCVVVAALAIAVLGASMS